MTDLKDKVVLITGSSSGIGQTLAVRFAEEGSKIVINYRENKQGAEDTAKQIEKIGSEYLLIQADVSKPNDVERLFKETVNGLGTVDILINNAASTKDQNDFMKESKSEDYKNMFDNNVVSVMMCSQRAAQIMLEKGRGKIINTSSIKGWEYGGGGPVYAASKAAVNSFTRTFAKIVAPNIQVNSVAPGYVKTRSYDNIDPARIKKLLDQTYLKRWVTIDEIADAFIFLARNDAMTGQVIYVEAGFMLK
jgi:3-oxoacyl-[acyl-carrier protein] reductase